MTQDTKHASRRAALPAATLAALLLAGCSSGNIGESWQCPLAKGGSCDSVAAADPAVPDAGGRTVLGEPLWQVRERTPEPRSETACTAGCGGGFDPFAWLAQLFGESNDGGDERSAARQPEPATAGKTGTVPADPDREADAAASSAAPEPVGLQLAEPAAAAFQAEPELAAVGPQADDLRTGEVVARIWIAPFVDADGVYREASYIRVVLEPAGWRLP
ncbi:MAG: TraV family lipoprotein [Rhodospirillales bacterium]|nr:TraV family lipoprotein [Rhodospirillales bacterium]